MSKKKLKKTLIFLAVVVTGLIFVACSLGGPYPLVGTWAVGDNRIIFLEDGTGEQVNLGRGFSNEFRWTEGARIPYALTETLGIEFYEYEIDGDTLILSRERTDGTEATLTFRRE